MKSLNLLTREKERANNLKINCLVINKTRFDISVRKTSRKIAKLFKWRTFFRQKGDNFNQNRS